MSTELKKKWYQGFALGSTVFFIAIYMYIENIATYYWGMNKISYAIYAYFCSFLIGFFLYIIIYRFPLLELFSIYLFSAILNWQLDMGLFGKLYITSILGSLLGCLIVKFLHGNKFRLKIHTKVLIYFKNNNFITKPYIKFLLIFVLLIIFFIVFIIVYVQPSTNFQIFAISALLFFGGIILGYLYKKKSVLIMILSLVVFYPIIKLAILNIKYLHPLINYFLLFLPYYILGIIIGNILIEKLKFMENNIKDPGDI